MIVISDLSQNYIQEVPAAEMSAVVGGSRRKGYSYSRKEVYVDLYQVNVLSKNSGNYADVRIYQ
jgi:hypothetical protein